jgi:hypothetical protein
MDQSFSVAISPTRRLTVCLSASIPRIAMRRHQPVGLVVAPQAGALRSVDQFSPDQHKVAGRHERSGVGDDGVVEPDFSLGDQFFGVTPARASHFAMRSPRCSAGVGAAASSEVGPV